MPLQARAVFEPTAVNALGSQAAGAKTICVSTIMWIVPPYFPKTQNMLPQYKRNPSHLFHEWEAEVELSRDLSLPAGYHQPTAEAVKKRNIMEKDTAVVDL